MKKKLGVMLLGILLLATGCKEKHTHEWKEATCTTAKTCVTCNETEGSELGHTTSLGKCSRCNVYQGKDTIDGIIRDLESVNSKVDMTFNGALLGSDYYSSFSSAAKEFATLKKEYQSISSKCDGIDDLSTLKKNIDDMANSLPTSIGSNSESELNSFINKLEDMAYKEAYLQTEMENVKAKIK